MRTAMLAWAGRSVVSAIDRLSATEMKRSGIEVRKQTGTQSGWSRCSRQHNADGHACMSRAQCGVCYRQAVRDRDEAKRNRGAETDWHAVRTYRIREILYGKYRKGIP